MLSMFLWPYYTYGYIPAMVPQCHPEVFQFQQLDFNRLNLGARQVVDADSNSWSAKQTFDAREKSGARHVQSSGLKWICHQILDRTAGKSGWFCRCLDRK